jgi:hypothetical protein
MLVNFEHVTQNLNSEDKKIVPYLQKVLETKTIDKPALSEIIVWETNMLIRQAISTGNHSAKIKKIDDVKLRRLINYMRTHDILPVCSTSKGYFISYDKKVLEKQIVSLSQRANSIMSCAYGLERFIKIEK